MTRFLIERRLEDAGKLTPQDLQSITRTSNAVLDDMRREGPAPQWIQSFITDDAIYCVYVAPNAETVREHARRSGFPADQIMEVRTIFGPTTAV